MNHRSLILTVAAVVFCCNAHSECDASFSPSETQASVRAKLACLDAEVRRLQAENRRLTTLNEQIRSQQANTNSRGSTYYFGAVTNYNNCLQRTKQWILKSGGRVDNFSEWWLFGAIKGSDVFVSCGVWIDELKGKDAGSAGVLLINSPNQDTAEALIDRFKGSSEAPF